MKARFKGINGSMGFVNGRVYNIMTRCGYLWGKKENPCIIVIDTESKQRCPYSNMETILENWEILK